MPIVDTGEVRLYYEEHGSGVPLVFLHGFTLDRRMWSRQVEYFEQWYRVIAYDSRGHGKSECPETGYSRQDRVRDLKRFLEVLNLDRFHVVGLSMGGATALGYAIDYPETLHSLTLVDTAAGGYTPPSRYKDHREIALKKGVDEAKRRWIRSSLFYYAQKNEKLRKKLAGMMEEHCGHLWLDPKRDMYTVRDDVSLSTHIHLPTMIFIGEKDRYFLPLAKKLHNLIPGSEIDIIPGIGHMANMESPDRFNFRLKQFLERVDVK